LCKITSSAVAIHDGSPKSATRNRRLNISRSNGFGCNSQKSTFNADRVSSALN